ncbi:uncharacterized protein Gasu_31910 [Galdieria sulphuraria]|uniref:Uncharacterized protein n=1 Tax=Galdieria sulphuraria TaxID=130081 RepID=M2XH30_GALSU|nr:uncharacterized protein Gasu_31910 [Galdieria sulphuraria]EME29362.1 hypothetical protein Gasu_31910 [Galdieria sulphuraria]|eukprot:XP_005705882.1 hypothetical protein Gasu_31910 [Galdieria sulphuraria]
MILLIISEVGRYWKPQVTTHLVVDYNREESFEIYLDITFPHIGCGALGLDTMDATGDSQLEVVNSKLSKFRVFQNGSQVLWNQSIVEKDGKVHSFVLEEATNCKSCYGAQISTDQCCNTCEEEVLLAYEWIGWSYQVEQFEQCHMEGVVQWVQSVLSQGCHFQGTIEVAK